MTGYTDTALNFVSELVNGDFAAARAMLTPALRADYQESDLQTQLEQMVVYTGQTAQGASVAIDNSMDDWPDKQPDDAGWAYVSIFKESTEGSFAEAVTLVITTDGFIRELAWGRP
jgi:hypothetical protein